ncbi:MAG: methionine biosynthesis protein MetW [Terriglobales bacterium]
MRDSTAITELEYQHQIKVMRCGFLIMQDSGLKRFLVSGFFSMREVLSAASGMFKQHEFRPENANYESYWQERGPGAIHPRFQIIARQLRLGETVLDVGCGDGAMLEYFSREKGVHGVGIDVSSVAVKTARERGVDARLQNLGQFYREVGKTGFDHVIMSEVLEHLTDSEDYVAKGWQLAVKTLWLTFPNIAYFPHRLRLLAGRFPVQWAVFPSEHVRFWSIPDFQFWLKQLGMMEPRMYASNGLTIFGLHRMWPNLLGNQIVVQLNK